jgi:hypothetical protein
MRLLSLGNLIDRCGYADSNTCFNLFMDQQIEFLSVCLMISLEPKPAQIGD